MKKRFLNISVLSAAALSLVILCPGCAGSQKNDTSDEDHEIHKNESNEHDREGHGHDHGDLIEFDDHMAEHFGVLSTQVSPADFSEVIPVSGRIETKASDEAVATATRSGILTFNSDINSGTSVSAGTPLARIASAAVQGSDPTLQPKAVRDAAKRELDRLTPLHSDGIVSERQYNEARKAYEEAEASLRSSGQGSASVVSPKSGVITQLLAKSGEYVEAGQKIAVISGNTSLTLRADVPEKYISELRKIETANFRPASSDSVLSVTDLGGRLISDPGTAVSENGYIPLYFIFNNNGAVAPGTFAEVYLKSGIRHDVMFVPKEAIVEVSGNKCVYTSLGGGHYAKHVVATGASDGRNVEILSGLHSGENVVVKGAQVIRMAETSSAAVPGHTHNH